MIKTNAQTEKKIKIITATLKLFWDAVKRIINKK